MMKVVHLRFHFWTIGEGVSVMQKMNHLSEAHIEP